MEMPKKSLLPQIQATPRYRGNGLDPATRNIVVFAHRDKVAEACEKISAHCPAAAIRGICAHKGDHQEYKANIHGQIQSIPSVAAEEFLDMPNCTGVIYWSGSIVPDTLYQMRSAAALSRDMAIFPAIPFGVGRRHNPTLYERHGDKLEAIYSSLADSESKLAFASVIKALCKGEIEWLRPAPCLEYEYPTAKAKEGDIILDAGLFDSSVLRKFALEAGSSGHVYGFEPEPHNFRYVQETLKTYGDPGNITLVQKGVFSRAAVMGISDEGASGALCDQAEGSLCETIDIDTFVKASNLDRVDLIKMDIEGAEMAALHGARETISKWLPKLHICAYHRPDDIVEIPEFINSIASGYKFYFAAHAPYLNEFVYYGVAE